MTKGLRVFLWFRLPVYIYAVIVLFLSSAKEPTMPAVEWIPFFDKYMHVFMYLILGFLLVRMLKNLGYAFSYKKYIFLSIFISTLYGALMEIYQLFIPYRSCDIIDLTADFIGATIGTLVYIKFSQKAYQSG